MATTFIERNVKAGWGIACLQSADGLVWVGKGKVCRYAEQFSVEEEDAIRDALERGRGNRNGHLWVNRQKRIVTMQVGLGYKNCHLPKPF
jgi:hypothetical protein